MTGQEYKLYNCYDVLGVGPKASPEEINRARNKQSLIHHPDKGGSHEEQIKINIAYSVLSDPIQRQKHDEYWINPSYSKITRSQSRRPQEKKAVYTTPTSETTYPNQILKGLRKRVLDHIEKEKKRIQEDLEGRIKKFGIEIKQVLSKKRQEAAVLILLIPTFSYGASYLELQCVWVLVAYFSWTLLSSVVGVKVANHRVSILNFSPRQLDNVARRIAQESCDKDIADLQQGVSVLSYLSKLLSRQSTFNDSEEYVAQQLAISFFLMGYKPSWYDRENRILSFLNGETKFLVRFRHRGGVPTNIAYVEKLVNEMKLYGVSKGFLFCSSSISSNAASYAGKNNIKWYTLDTMNSWIMSVLASDRIGPEGNILIDLINLKTLIDTIVPKIPVRRHSSYSRYRRNRY